MPIPQILANYRTNLALFAPQREHARLVHSFLVNFYSGFPAAAAAVGCAENGQPGLLERTQKALWVFARQAEMQGDALVLGQEALRAGLKFPRPEEVFALLKACGLLAECYDGANWSPDGKLKASLAARLRCPANPALAPALAELARSVFERKAKEKPAFERFLRADPDAVVAGDVPPLSLPPDAPALLANLAMPAAADAWRELTRELAVLSAYTPVVEFRSIHHALWVVNYVNRRSSGRDICGLIAQNGCMQVRAILYGGEHFYVKEHLADFSLPIQSAFARAHYYEEFEHQWLFIDCQTIEDARGILHLLSFLASSRR